MANDMRNYDQMSRDELLDLLGDDADQAASREDLVMMAMAKDQQAS